MAESHRIDVGGALQRLQGRVVTTLLVEWPGRGIWLKCENLQATGSFKLRGALNKVFALHPAERERGLVAASAGNHGIGVALAARVAGAQATVVVPRNVVEPKRLALERLGAEVLLAEGDYGVAEREGRRLADERQASWVSPYNDPLVIAGQATVGIEIARQSGVLPSGGRIPVYVPVSGGGLLAGVGLGLRHEARPVRLVGVQTQSAPYIHRFFYGGDMSDVVETPTIADGLAGAVEPGSITFDLIRSLTDEVVLVSEQEIEWALLDLAESTGMLVEPSAAAAAAAAQRSGETPAVVVLSGGNVDPAIFTRLGWGQDA